MNALKINHASLNKDGELVYQLKEIDCIFDVYLIGLSKYSSYLHLEKTFDKFFRPIQYKTFDGFTIPILNTDPIL